MGGADDERLQTTRAVVQNYLPDDMEDLESLILLGKLEMEPKRKSEIRMSKSETNPKSECSKHCGQR